MKKRIWIIIAAVVIIAVIALIAVNNSKNKAAAASAFQTVAVEKGVLTGTVGATGSVRANQSAILIWETSGTVGKVLTKIDQQVKKDQFLAELEKTSLAQNVILAEADLVTAQKALDELMSSNVASAQALLAVDDAQEVYDKALDYREGLDQELEGYKLKKTRYGYYPIKIKYYADQATIDEADAKLAVAEAKLNDAKRELERLKDGPDTRDIAAAMARVAAAQAAMDLGKIKAPFDGTITDDPVKTGDVVSAGTTAFRVDDLSHLYVDVLVSEVDINRVKVGQKATLTFDAILGKEYEGKVTEVARVGSVATNVVNFKVTVELLNPDEDVRSNMTAAVNIIIAELSDVILIPNRAVRSVDGNRVVYVLKDGKPEQVTITLGATSDAYSEMATGEIKTGDLIILNPPNVSQGNMMFGPGGR
jgi:HlyD family secretion protein